MDAVQTEVQKKGAEASGSRSVVNEWPPGLKFSAALPFPALAAVCWDFFFSASTRVFDDREVFPRDHLMVCIPKLVQSASGCCPNGGAKEGSRSF